jgi:hypothetical protein
MRPLEMPLAGFYPGAGIQTRDHHDPQLTGRAATKLVGSSDCLLDLKGQLVGAVGDQVGMWLYYVMNPMADLLR